MKRKNQENFEGSSSLADRGERVYTRDMSVHISALLDIVFKYMLGSKESPPLLTSFINAVEEDSGFPEIEGVTIRNPFNEKNFFDDKLSVIDVRARDKEGSWYNIEVQLQSQPYFSKRSLYYWSNTYSNQLSSGKNYEELNKVITINLVDFISFPDRDPWHSCFLLREKDDPEFVLTLDLVIHFIEIPKAGTRVNTKLEQWLYVLRRLGEEEDEKMKVLMDENWEFRDVKKRYDDFIADEQARIAAFSREMFLHDQASREAYAKKNAENAMKEGWKKGWEKGQMEGQIEGRKEGREEGREEGKKAKALETAAKLKALGLETEKIVEATGISIEEATGL